MQINLPPHVREEDIHKMVRALEAFRGDQWWFKEENNHGKGRYLTALTLNNMLIGLDEGTLEPNPFNFKNALITALYFEKKCRENMASDTSKEHQMPSDAKVRAALSALKGGQEWCDQEFEAMRKALTAASSVR